MQFTGTQWTLIRAANAGDTAALEAFVKAYHPAVVVYLRQRGFTNDADDIAQEVFLRVFEGGVLSRATPQRGHFRHLMLAVTKNTLASFLAHKNRKKRGGAHAHVPLDEALTAGTPPDVAFDQAWLTRLLAAAFARLESEHPRYYQALDLFVRQGRAQDAVAAELGVRRQSVKNYVHRGRTKLLIFLREEVWSYCSSQVEYEEELHHLATLLPQLR